MDPVTSSGKWRRCGGGYSAPMRRVLRAASMTSLVITLRPLIFKMRSICVKRRCRSRKLPHVMRLTAATAWVSVKSSRSRVSPMRRQWRVRTKASSSSVRGEPFDQRDELGPRAAQPAVRALPASQPGQTIGAIAAQPALRGAQRDARVVRRASQRHTFL